MGARMMQYSAPQIESKQAVTALLGALGMDLLGRRPHHPRHS